MFIKNVAACKLFQEVPEIAVTDAELLTYDNPVFLSYYVNDYYNFFYFIPQLYILEHFPIWTGHIAKFALKISCQNNKNAKL